MKILLFINQLNQFYTLLQLFSNFHLYCAHNIASSLGHGKNFVVEQTKDGAAANHKHNKNHVYSLYGDAEVVGGEVKKFWTNTGFSPPAPHNETESYFFGEGMWHNLQLLGAIPYHGIRQVRIHWLLNLVTVTSISNAGPVYNFTYLDDLISMLHKNGLRPGFELMGNPSNLFSDYENATQLYMWADLIYQVARRYIDLYEIDEVGTWNFESWNEPDCHEFHTRNITKQGYLNYYDACSRGLHSASPHLRFGGPGDGCHDNTRHSYAYALYRHVTHGRDYFTGKRGVRLDYISLHKKGSGSTKNILHSEMESMRQIERDFPSLAHKPFYNDEADILVGWWKAKPWRADATYAALVTKVIAQHQNNILFLHSPPLNYTLLSNDNAFLSYFPHQFTQRTLTAQFQINNTASPHVQLIKKPVYAVMGLLSLLGDCQVVTKLTDSQGKPVSNLSNVGALVTLLNEPAHNTSRWELSALLYYVKDPNNSSTSHSQPHITVNVKLKVPQSILDQGAKVAVFSVDNTRTNPYMVWTQQGRPDFPTRDQFMDIRMHKGAALIGLYNITSPFIHLPVGLTNPQVILMHVCVAVSLPKQVRNLQVSYITTGQVLISWNPGFSRCIRAYHIKFRRKTSSSVTKSHFIGFNNTSTSFVYSPLDKVVQGEYRVRIVDYWDTVGPWTSVSF